MDENTWKLAQIGMWVIGIQTTILGGIFIFLWSNLNGKINDVFRELSKRIDDLSIKVDRNEAKFNAKLDTKLDPILESINDLDKRLNELDKRLYGIEAVLHMKECCVLKQDQQLKKAE